MQRIVCLSAHNTSLFVTIIELLTQCATRNAACGIFEEEVGSSGERHRRRRRCCGYLWRFMQVIPREIRFN